MGWGVGAGPDLRGAGTLVGHRLAVRLAVVGVVCHAGLGFIPALTWWRWRGLTPGQMAPLLKRGVFGALIAYVSFGGIMPATRIDRVGEAAALRETSVVFAALIGWWILGEKTGPVQVGLMGLIAAGAVVMESAG